jgi:hypothetical protein
MSVGQLFFAQKILYNFNFGACLLAKWHGTSGVNQTFGCKCLEVKCFCLKDIELFGKSVMSHKLCWLNVCRTNVFWPKRHGNIETKLYWPTWCQTNAFWPMTGPELCHPNIVPDKMSVTQLFFAQKTLNQTCINQALRQPKCLLDNCFLPKRHGTIWQKCYEPQIVFAQCLSAKCFLTKMTWGRIFSHVQSFYEWAVSDLDPLRSMHRSV